MKQLVPNVILNWERMGGESEEVQKINALVTSAFLGIRDFPADECLTEAQVILTHFMAEPPEDAPNPWKDRARAHLRVMFAEGVDGKGGRVKLPQFHDAVDDTVERIEALLKGGPWPDRPVLL
mgnify:CR=1 FL=1|jgi:hypothetical protein